MLDEEDFGIVFEVENLRFPLVVLHTAILTKPRGSVSIMDSDCLIAR